MRSWCQHSSIPAPQQGWEVTFTHHHPPPWITLGLPCFLLTTRGPKSLLNPPVLIRSWGREASEPPGMQKPRGGTPQKSHQEVIFQTKPRTTAPASPMLSELAPKPPVLLETSRPTQGQERCTGILVRACGEAETSLLNPWVTRTRSERQGRGRYGHKPRATSHIIVDLKRLLKKALITGKEKNNQKP